MVNRIWDQDNAYTAGFLKSYTYWTVEVSYRQHTLGSFIIFLNRFAERMSDISKEESEELPIVMKAIENALETTPELQPERFNYLQLGNAITHLHIHGIPRYKEPRELLGRAWNDRTYGKPPTWTFTNEKHETITKIKDLILPHL
jgi:diadenosine tetraphosphate (Ap4A) HIT family hydrolase